MHIFRCPHRRSTRFPALLEVGDGVSAQISERIRENYEVLKRLVTDHSGSRVLLVEGGWYAVSKCQPLGPKKR